ncbi:hypothetical protein RJ640_024691 [Escallonia rubra]|uniref:Protein CHAPERONE-LIKE PROTEIN OF POR1, chloroplastic n=1 Tax=Escallonia rubra TaxID=112253 RepID=A0AA88R764_9ASTE|nr:hypothetical protein RJ640_024691 [Escallonia rubra]
MATLTLSNPCLPSPFFGNKLSIRGNWKRLTPCIVVLRSPRCALDASYGGNVSKFPRVSVWDPYKRLGITTDASEEEVWSSRNFLLNQYAGHERSAESIEAAFEKILMASFQNRKRTKINLKSRLKKKVEESPPWVKNLLSFVEAPPTVALSLGACIYFLNDKTKSLARASIIGLGSLVAGWICGSLLVPMIPAALLQPTWTLELLTSLASWKSAQAWWQSLRGLGGWVVVVLGRAPRSGHHRRGLDRTPRSSSSSRAWGMGRRHRRGLVVLYYGGIFWVVFAAGLGWF